MDADRDNSRTVSPDVYDLHQSGNDSVSVNNINLWNKYMKKMMNETQMNHLSTLVGRSPGGDRIVHGGHSNTTIGTFPRGGVAQTVDGGSFEDDLLHPHLSIMVISDLARRRCSRSCC